MRTTRACVVVMILLILCAGTVAAQTVAGKFAITPHVGLGIPVGDFADTDTTNANRGGATTGIILGGSGEYYFSENFAAGVRFLYNRFGIDPDTYGDRLMGGTIDGHLTATEFGAFIKYIFTSQSTTKVYGTAGFLFSKVKLKGDYSIPDLDLTGSGEASLESAFGMEGGIGVMHMLKDNVAICGEFTYTTRMTDGKNADVTDPFSGETSTEETKGNADSLGLKAGVSFFFGGQ
jgi:hypothetical protein